MIRAHGDRGIGACAHRLGDHERGLAHARTLPEATDADERQPVRVRELRAPPALMLDHAAPQRDRADRAHRGHRGRRGHERA